MSPSRSSNKQNTPMPKQLELIPLMSVTSFTRIERGLGGTHDLKITKVHFFTQIPVNIIVSRYNAPALVPAEHSNFDV